MRVTDLIEQLQKMPQEAEVKTLRSDDNGDTFVPILIKNIYLSDSGDVIIIPKYTPLLAIYIKKINLISYNHER